MFGSQSLPIKVKLRGAMGDLLEPEFQGKQALLKNLVLDRYGGKNSLASTPETELIVSTFMPEPVCIVNA